MSISNIFFKTVDVAIPVIQPRQTRLIQPLIIQVRLLKLFSSLIYLTVTNFFFFKFNFCSLIGIEKKTDKQALQIPFLKQH